MSKLSRLAILMPLALLLALSVVGPLSPSLVGVQSTGQVASTYTNWYLSGKAVGGKIVNGTVYSVGDAAGVYAGNGVFRIYYNNFTGYFPAANSTQGVYSAVSTDGIHWTVEPGARIENSCGPPFPFVLQASGGVIKIVLGCGDVYDSTDGIHFTKESSQMFLPVEQGAEASGPPYVYSFPNGTFRAYSGVKYANSSDPNQPYFEIYSYLSSDGYNYTKEAGVRLAPEMQLANTSVMVPTGGGGNGHPIVYQLANGTWIMFYEITGFGPNSPFGAIPTPIGVATSPNGVNWAVTQITGLTNAEPYYMMTAKDGTTSLIFGCNDPDNSSSLIPMLCTALPRYTVSYLGTNYTIGLKTNSTISSWSYAPNNNELKFDVAQISGGFLNVTIPSSLMNGTFTVSVDGKQANYTSSGGALSTSVVVRYGRSTSSITISAAPASSTVSNSQQSSATKSSSTISVTTLRSTLSTSVSTTYVFTTDSTHSLSTSTPVNPTSPAFVWIALTGVVVIAVGGAFLALRRRK